MTPIDEVRTVMAAFDETIFQVVPRVYRALDEARREADAGQSAPAVPAFLRYGSWVGADRDGNPFVTAQVTRETAVIQAEHVLRALENAATRIGRALTVNAGDAPPSPGSPWPWRRPRRPSRSCSPTWPPARRTSRTGPTCSTWPGGSRPPGCGRRTWPTPAPQTSWPTCGWSRSPWPPQAPPGRRSVSCSS